MPTIDQLSQATAASDTDEFLASQNGVTRKVTRRQIVTGLQAELLIAPGVLLGRSSTGIGDPEPLNVGSNLVLANGTLSATAAPFVVANLPAGVVPAPGDLVAVGQGGANAAIPYAQFVSGLSSVPGVDGSALSVTPSGGGTPTTLGNLAASMLPKSGGTMTGPLGLAGPPTHPLDAASKAYVDAASASALPLAGGALTGPLTLPADPTQPMHATTREYVDSGLAQRLDLTATAQQTMAGSLHLPGLYTEQEGSTPTDYAVLNTRYTVTHSGGTAGTVNSNARFDTTVASASASFIWGTTSVLTYTGSGSTGQHVASYSQANRNAYAPGGASSNPEIWAAAFESRDATGQPSSATNSQLAMEVDLFANGADDGAGGLGHRQLQSMVIAQHNPAGTAVECGIGTGYYLAAGSQGSFKQVVHVGAPFSQSAFDTRNGTQGTAAHAIWLGDGHHIALNSAGTRYITWDSGTDELRYYRNGLFTPLGCGIAFNAELVLSGSTSLLPTHAGYAIFAGGAAPSTVTLPSIGAMQFGTGFTFLIGGTAPVSIATSNGNVIDGGPVTLYPGDRYTIISDGIAAWREVWRTNSQQTRFSAPPVLPGYAVASLPSGPLPGSKAYATNGRKPGEAAGAGTGVEVFADGSGRWFSVLGGGVVVA